MSSKKVFKKPKKVDTLEPIQICLGCNYIICNCKCLAYETTIDLMTKEIKSLKEENKKLHMLIKNEFEEDITNIKNKIDSLITKLDS